MEKLTSSEAGIDIELEPGPPVEQPQTTDFARSAQGLWLPTGGISSGSSGAVVRNSAGGAGRNL